MTQSPELRPFDGHTAATHPAREAVAPRESNGAPAREGFSRVLASSEARANEAGKSDEATQATATRGGEKPARAAATGGTRAREAKSSKGRRGDGDGDENTTGATLLSITLSPLAVATISRVPPPGDANDASTAVGRAPSIAPSAARVTAGVMKVSTGALELAINTTQIARNVLAASGPELANGILGISGDTATALANDSPALVHSDAGIALDAPEYAYAALGAPTLTAGAQAPLAAKTATPGAATQAQGAAGTMASLDGALLSALRTDARVMTSAQPHSNAGRASAQTATNTQPLSNAGRASAQTGTNTQPLSNAGRASAQTATNAGRASAQTAENAPIAGTAEQTGAAQSGADASLMSQLGAATAAQSAQALDANSSAHSANAQPANATSTATGIHGATNDRDGLMGNAGLRGVARTATDSANDALANAALANAFTPRAPTASSFDMESKAFSALQARSGREPMDATRANVATARVAEPTFARAPLTTDALDAAAQATFTTMDDLGPEPTLFGHAAPAITLAPALVAALAAKVPALHIVGEAPAHAPLNVAATAAPPAAALAPSTAIRLPTGTAPKAGASRDAAPVVASSASTPRPVREQTTSNDTQPAGSAMQGQTAALPADATPRGATQADASDLDVETAARAEAASAAVDGAATTTPVVTTPQGSPLGATRQEAHVASRPATAAAAETLEPGEKSDRQAIADIGVSRLALRRGVRAEADIPDLGRIAVEAKPHLGAIDVSVHTARAETATLLRGARAELENRLETSSVPVRQVSISTGSGAASGGTSDNGQSRRSRQEAKGDVEASETSGDAPANGKSRRVRIVLLVKIPT